MKTDPSRIIQRLERVVTEERDHLLKGEIEKFPDLFAEKEELLKELASLEKSQIPNLENLQSEFAYNHNLLESAMRGIRATAERLRVLSEVRDQLETYDQRGKRQKYSTRQSVDFEKRA